MAAGKIHKNSPIVDAIKAVEKTTTCEIRVHFSKSWLEQNTTSRAWHIFKQHGMERTTYRNALLIYANLRKRKFAIIADEGLSNRVPTALWNAHAEGLSKRLKGAENQDQIEKAFAETIAELGPILTKLFPIEAGGKNLNELPDGVI